MIVVRLVSAVAGDVEVAGAVDAVDVAVGAGAGIEPEPEFEFDVEVTMFGIVVDELEVVKEEETVDIANEVVVIEHAGEGPDIVAVAVAAAAVGVEVVGIDAFASYIVDADIGEEAVDYAGVA